MSLTKNGLFSEIAQQSSLRNGSQIVSKIAGKMGGSCPLFWCLGTPPCIWSICGANFDKRITAIDYDKYAKKYNDEKVELERKLVEYTNNDKSFVVTSSYLLRLASKAKDVFESSQPEKKNKILKMLLANCQINQKRLQLNLLKPFDGLLLAMKSQNWLGE